MKKKRLKIGNRIAVMTPQYTYLCIVYKRTKAAFYGQKYDYVVIDELSNPKPR